MTHFFDEQQIKSGKDFKELFESLPIDIQKLKNWLDIDFIPSSQRKHIANSLQVQHAGFHGKQLADYGLYPCNFFEFSNYFVHFLAYDYDKHNVSNGSGEFVIFNVDGVDKKIYLSYFNELSFIPQNHKEGLFKWTLELMKLKPDCVQRFHIKFENGKYFATMIEKLPDPMMVDMYDDDPSESLGHTPYDSHRVKMYTLRNKIQNFFAPVYLFFYILCVPLLYLINFILAPYRYLKYTIEKKIWQVQRSFSK